MERPQQQSEQKCPRCCGLGAVEVRTKDGQTKREECPECRGSGRRGYWTK